MHKVHATFLGREFSMQSTGLIRLAEATLIFPAIAGQITSVCQFLFISLLCMFVCEIARLFRHRQAEVRAKDYWRLCV